VLKAGCRVRGTKEQNVEGTKADSLTGRRER
jgi:hypothetical protein